MASPRIRLRVILIRTQAHSVEFVIGSAGTLRRNFSFLSAAPRAPVIETLYDGDAETVKSVLATFFEVFPDGTVWSNHVDDRGYDLVLVGRTESAPINVDRIQNKLDDADHAPVLASLHAVGFNSAMDVLGTYLGHASDLKPLLASAQINIDRNLRLQYLAGLELNGVDPERSYQALLAYRRFPEGLFVGSEHYIRELIGKLPSK